MRWIIVGVALLCFAASALAQAKGEVESIGFQGTYRPDCWTPMVVSLTPDTPESATYLLQVHQQDMDGDRVVYQRTITLTGQGPGGTPRQQRFWMYFLPQSRRINGVVGLPQPSSSNRAELQAQLKVTLATPSGKFIAALPITSTATSTEPPRTTSQPMRSKRLVLSISDRNPSFEQPMVQEYSSAVGLMEDVEFIMLDPDQLPDDPIAYQGIDAIVFLQSDPSRLKYPTDERFQAITSYVRGGGKLVICQTSPWELMLEWGELLPVRYPRYGTGTSAIQGIVTRQSNEPLASLAKSQMMSDDPWYRLKSYPIGVAEALPDSRVIEWTEWKTKDQPLPAQTPFLVRRSLGAGSVTWVATDLGNVQLTGILAGWANIWDRVMDWPNQSFVGSSQRYSQVVINRMDENFKPAIGADLGSMLLPGIEHGSTGAKLVALAGIFFVIFWVAAGPGSYLALAARKKAKYSWFAYAAISMGAVVLSVGIVQFALRGDPSIKHFTLARSIPNQDTRLTSLIGLYIPQDGQMQLSMPGSVSTQAVSWVAPLPVHPQLVIRQDKQPEFITKLNYTVDVRSLASAQAPELTVPFRTTLKKFRADWAGHLASNSGIVGNVRLPAPGTASPLELEGSLTNGTPYTLQNVYLCFTNADGRDVLMFIPQWKPSQTFDLQNSIQWKRLRLQSNADDKFYGLPTDGNPPFIREYLNSISPSSIYGDNGGWVAYWYLYLRSQAGIGSNGDISRFPFYIQLLCLYDRLPPMTTEGAGSSSRNEILRMGARQMDLSSSISAGNLAVFGMTQGPLPQPFEVNGNPVESDGLICWQSVVPIQRPESPNPPPATAPATRGSAE